MIRLLPLFVKLMNAPKHANTYACNCRSLKLQPLTKPASDSLL